MIVDLEAQVIEIRRVVCPIDFSEFSRHALQHAIAVAKWYGSSLTVIHVVANLPTMDVPGVPLTAVERERVMAEMQSFAGHLPPEISARFLVREASDVHRAILAEAQALMTDVLVIGTHGRSGFERLLLGSVTEKVVRKSPCPVMVVPPRVQNAAGPGLIHGNRPRILCAVDFSDVSLAALEYAMSLAEEADADLSLLHAIEVPPELLEHIPVPPDFDVDQCRAAARAGCDRRLRELVPPSVHTYCHVNTVVAEGAPHREILRLSAEQKSDLIVMGVHGRSAVDALVFGSNTARVSRGALCPVLMVPRHEGKR
jgi:nucleotide-binding universal stress UspA family protein